MKMQSRSVIFLIVSLSLIGWGTSPPVRGNSFTANLSGQMLNQEVSGKVCVTDGHYRTEFRPKNEQDGKHLLVVIVDRHQGRTLLLAPQAKTCDEVESLTPRAFMTDPFQSIAHLERVGQRRMVGGESVAGFQGGQGNSLSRRGPWCDEADQYEYDSNENSCRSRGPPCVRKFRHKKTLPEEM